MMFRIQCMTTLEKLLARRIQRNADALGAAAASENTAFVDSTIKCRQFSELPQKQDVQQQQPHASTSESVTSKQPRSVNWDWGFVIGRTPGRKPAIKRPQRHQWYFCNPNYDANLSLPQRILPPHAPASAAHVDEWQLFQSTLGGKLTPRSRKEFVQFLKLRDIDWRDAFHKGLAKYVADFKKEQRLEAEKLRQRAWHEYREAVFAKALHQAE